MLPRRPDSQIHSLLHSTRRMLALSFTFFFLAVSSGLAQMLNVAFCANSNCNSAGSDCVSFTTTSGSCTAITTGSGLYVKTRVSNFQATLDFYDGRDNSCRLSLATASAPTDGVYRYQRYCTPSTSYPQYNTR